MMKDLNSFAEFRREYLMKADTGRGYCMLSTRCGYIQSGKYHCYPLSVWRRMWQDIKTGSSITDVDVRLHCHESPSGSCTVH